MTKQTQEPSLLDQLFNLSLVYFCVANKHGYAEKVSPVFSKELGFSGEALLTEPFYRFIQEEAVEATAKEFEKVETSKRLGAVIKD